MLRRCSDLCLLQGEGPSTGINSQECSLEYGGLTACSSPSIIPAVCCRRVVVKATSTPTWFRKRENTYFLAVHQHCSGYGQRLEPTYTRAVRYQLVKVAQPLALSSVSQIQAFPAQKPAHVLCGRYLWTAINTITGTTGILPPRPADGRVRGTMLRFLHILLTGELKQLIAVN